MPRILFYLDGSSHRPWKEALETIDPSVDFRGNPDWGTPDDGPAYAFVWFPTHGLLKKYTNLKAIFSLGAGVDHLLADPDLPTHIPIIRMGDDGLKEGMAEYVTMAVLMHHREMPRFLTAQADRKWVPAFARAAHSVRVGIMGYGALGAVAAKALIPFGYDLAAWSRTPKTETEGIKHYSGPEGLKEFLKRTDILVSLLPSTAETKGLLNRETLSLLPQGAAVINAGRGSLIILGDLQALLDSNHISAATLDVFPAEPLPVDHPLWNHEKVIITPHIASITRPDSAADFVLRNIKKLEAGEATENKLQLNLGY